MKSKGIDWHFIDHFYHKDLCVEVLKSNDLLGYKCQIMEKDPKVTITEVFREKDKAIDSAKSIIDERTKNYITSTGRQGEGSGC